MPRGEDARELARDAGVPEGQRCQCPHGRCLQVARGLRYCDDCFFEAGSDPAECLCECAGCKPLSATAAGPAAAAPVAALEGDEMQGGQETFLAWSVHQINRNSRVQRWEVLALRAVNATGGRYWRIIARAWVHVLVQHLLALDEVDSFNAYAFGSDSEDH